MQNLSVLVNVPDQAAPGRRRVAGLLDDNQTIVVASMLEGGTIAELELSFRLCDAVAIAEAALAGDRRAMTTPGLARILSTTAAILFRVSLHAGGLQQLGEIDERGGGHEIDRDEAAADEHPDE